jgi:hypothetical protein
VLDAIWKTRELPLMEGLTTPDAVAMDEVGPAPPIPAQVVQLDQGFILWICVLVVCAEADTFIAVAMAKSAMMHWIRFALFNFTLSNIFHLLQSGVLDRLILSRRFARQAGTYRAIYSASILFALLGLLRLPPSWKNPWSGLRIGSQRSLFPVFPEQIAFKAVLAQDSRRNPGWVAVCALDIRSYA